MKLIFCGTCQDIVKLDTEWRFCKCGECGGYYLSDLIDAEYTGASAIPLGIANSSLRYAINNQPETGMGLEFTAFVIPKECDSFEKIP